VRKPRRYVRLGFPIMSLSSSKPTGNPIARFEDLFVFPLVDNAIRIGFIRGMFLRMVAR